MPGIIVFHTSNYLALHQRIPIIVAKVARFWQNLKVTEKNIKKLALVLFPLMKDITFVCFIHDTKCIFLEGIYDFLNSLFRLGCYKLHVLVNFQAFSDNSQTWQLGFLWVFHLAQSIVHSSSTISEIVSMSRFCLNQAPIILGLLYVDLKHRPMWQKLLWEVTETQGLSLYFTEKPEQ